MEEEVNRDSINPGDREGYITNETTPLQREKSQDGGLRYITVTFTVVTILLSIALGVTLSQRDPKPALQSDVVSDRRLCSEVGRDVFRGGGNAVDAAVAVTFCLTVILPHLTSIAGNGIVLVYSQKTAKPLLCLDSWTSGGVPKLLLALFAAHNSHGKKSWDKILEPSIQLAMHGFPVTESLIQSTNHLSEAASGNLVIFLSSLKFGMNATNPELAEALRRIQKEGPDALYKGKLSSDLKEYYGNKSLSDLSLNTSPCLETTIGGYHLVSSGKGSGGPFLHQAIIQANLSYNYNISHLLEYFEGREELKWPLSSGVVVAASDDQDVYVSVVSGLGPVLGTQVLTSNGFILGSSFPGSPFVFSTGATFIASDAFSRCKKRIVTGGVDARDLLQVVGGLLWGDDIQAAVEGPRVRFRNGSYLKELTHAPSLPLSLPSAPLPYPTINVIQKIGDNVLSYPDSRSGI